MVEPHPLAVVEPHPLVVVELHRQVEGAAAVISLLEQWEVRAREWGWGL